MKPVSYERAGVALVCIDRRRRRNAIDGPTATLLEAGSRAPRSRPRATCSCSPAPARSRCAGAGLKEVEPSSRGSFPGRTGRSARPAWSSTKPTFIGDLDLILAGGSDQPLVRPRIMTEARVRPESGAGACQRSWLRNAAPAAHRRPRSRRSISGVSASASSMLRRPMPSTLVTRSRWPGVLGEASRSPRRSRASGRDARGPRAAIKGIRLTFDERLGRWHRRETAATRRWPPPAQPGWRRGGRRRPGGLVCLLSGRMSPSRGGRPAQVLLAASRPSAGCPSPSPRREVRPAGSPTARARRRL